MTAGGDEPPIDFSAHRRKGWDWTQTLIKTKDGTPRALLANAMAALRHAPEWTACIGYDEFCRRVEVTGLLPFPVAPDIGSQWTDHFDTIATEWMQHVGIHVSAEITGRAVQAIARERTFNPVRDYLDKLVWDGEPRLSEWTTRYLGCEPSPYAAAIGAKWAISAVARVYQPGVKADCCLILEGEQNIGKSKILRLLGEPWFTDELSDLGTKDSQMQLSGKWIIELSELDAMTRGEVSRIKAFMSRQVDRFRPPFGKHVADFPRQCVFAGTANLNDYLRDETGGRRFWPLACGTVDIDGISNVRDALWAEARDRYHADETWWIEDKGLIDAAKQQQVDRYQGDPWQPIIIQRLAECAAFSYDISIQEILGSTLNKPVKDQTQIDMNRVARILRFLGWEKWRAKSGSNREWRYRPMLRSEDGTNPEPDQTRTY